MAKAFKIAAIVLFCIAVALAGAAAICIKENHEAGGYLLFTAGVTVCVSAVCALVAIITDNGSDGKKAGKAILLTSPFLVFALIIGAIIVIGFIILLFMLYAADGILG